MLYKLILNYFMASKFFEINQLLFCMIFLLFMSQKTLAQSDSVIVKNFPSKFSFVDNNSDGLLQRSEVDYVVNSYLDNSVKYPKILVKEFVDFYNGKPTQMLKVDSIKIAPTKTVVPEKTNKVGMAILPVGSEFAIGGKVNFDKHNTLELRLARPSYTVNPVGNTSYSFNSELFYLRRIVAKPKVKFNVGLGARVEYANILTKETIRYGAVLPVSVEAFPFAVIPNGALFFEVAPIFLTAKDKSQSLFFRSASGFCIYF